MPVVVTPEPRSPTLALLDAVTVAPTAAASVTAWRESDATAIVVDSMDRSLSEEIRAQPDGQTVPLVLVTTENPTDGPADALLAPDADAETVFATIERAEAARDYRQAVTELFVACKDREIGQPREDILELRKAADDAYERLDELPPSAFYTPE